MVRQNVSRGFTLIEMLVGLLLISVILLISLPFVNRIFCKNINMIIDDIAYTQYQAIILSDQMFYDEYDCDVYFNRKGNVNHADTYQINGIDVVVSLGTGRIYVDEKEGEYFD